MQKQEVKRQYLSLESQPTNEEEMSNTELQKIIVRIISKLKDETHKLVTELKEDSNKQLKVSQGVQTDR
jgi:hypothetical protein